MNNLKSYEIMLIISAILFIIGTTMFIIDMGKQEHQRSKEREKMNNKYFKNNTYEQL